MVDDQDILRLLIIEGSLNEAETYVSALRSAGHAVRAKQVRTPDDLQARLAEQQYDLILCSTPLDSCRLEDAAAVVFRNEKDLPIVAVVERPRQEDLVAAIRAGARDAVPKGQNEHLRLAVDRELADLRVRRALREAEQHLREAERRNRELLDTARDAITYVTDGMHIRANDAYLKLFGFTDAEEIEGMPIMDMIAPDDLPTVKQFLRKLPGLSEGSQTLEVTGQRIDGRTFPLQMVFSPAVIDDEACFQIVIPAAAPQGDNEELKSKLRRLSDHDLLTGLYNRQYFIEALERGIADVLKGETRLALFLIALDSFDKITERVGIAASDLVVVDVAEALRNTVDTQQTIARFGDDTFAVLATCQQPQDAERLGEAIRHKIAEHVSEVSGQAVNATASVGLTLVSETAADAQELLTRARQCCEQVRNNGGNAVRTYTPSALDQAQQTSMDVMAAIVTNALKKGAFSLLFQPISGLRGQQHEYYEVFVRLSDESGNEIPTRQFLAAAEQGGLMPQLDRWVAQQAIQRLVEEHTTGRKIHFFLNIGESTLTDEEYLPWLAGMLKEARISGEHLVIEVKEPEASNHIQALRLLSKGLNALRARLALAQFGSGLNSLNFLKHVPAQFVKIDRAFMANLPGNTENQRAVTEITQLAHQLEMEVIAEFIEDANSLPLLWQSEVDYIQGYFLQEPSSSLDFNFSGESF